MHGQVVLIHIRRVVAKDVCALRYTQLAGAGTRTGNRTLKRGPEASSKAEKENICEALKSLKQSRDSRVLVLDHHRGRKSFTLLPICARLICTRGQCVKIYL